VGSGLERLLGARLLFVTGKGGTGKTTLALALARAVAGQGRRVCVAEVDNHRPSLTEYYGVVPGFEPTPVAPGLAVTNITWFEALQEWLGRFVPVQRVVRLILGNRMVKLFLDVTPGSREVVTFARLMQLQERFDLVVVDMPASGHAVSFFRVFSRATSLFPAGPVRRTMDEALACIARADTQLVLCALPEEMVINETVETWSQLAEVAPSLSVPLVVLNKALPPTLTSHEQLLLERLGSAGVSGELPGGEAARELIRAGCWEAERERATGLAQARLREQTALDLLLVPMMGAGGGVGTRVRRLEALLLRSWARSAQGGAIR
jgi:anion-transporting  ArsA/GET3 family ATPase